MNKLCIAIFTCAVLVGTVAPAQAQDSLTQAGAPQKSYEVKGVVVQLDKAASKVKLKHEAVPALKWPGMTMFFGVADKAQLDALKTGDRIEASFVPQSGGAPLITRISPVK